MTRRLLLFLALACTARAAVAGDETPPTRYTLERAVRTAVRLNHALAAARLEVERSDARVNEAWGYALPRLDLQAQYSRAIKKPVFFLPDFDNPSSGQTFPIEIGSDHSVTAGVTASQILFNPTVFIGVGAARIYSRAARETFRSRTMETITAARKAYYGVLVAREVRGMMQENLRNAEETLRNSKALTAQGLASEYDQLRAEVSVSNLGPEVIAAENGYTLALNNLKIALGLPYEQPIAVDDSLTYEPVDERVVATAIDSVLAMNPDLQALRLQTEVNDAYIGAERANYLPTLSAFGNYQFQTQQNDLRISTQDFVTSAAVGLSLNMNLFTGLQTNARVEQAELEYRKSQEQETGLGTSLRTLTESIILNLRRAEQQIHAQERTVEQARKGFKIASTRFSNGAGTQVEVRDAQYALTQARVNRIQAIFDYLKASAELDQVLGRVPAYLDEEREDE